MQFDLIYLGNLRTESVHSDNGSHLITDAPKDNHGKGEQYSPTDLMVVAAGSCALTLMGIAADRLGVDITGVKLTATKTMISSPIRRIGSIHLKVYYNQLLSPEVKEKLEYAARTCPVHASFHPDIQLVMEFFPYEV